MAVRMAIAFQLNGHFVSIDAPPDTPLLWVLREGLKLTGTKFGCGAGLCGACMVHLDDQRAFSCQTPVSAVEGRKVTTIEGLSGDSSHPVQRAWLAESVPQCGYCQSGQIMSAADLLNRNPNPSREEIIGHMSTNICRCGTYPRIVKAIQRAAREAKSRIEIANQILMPYGLHGEMSWLVRQDFHSRSSVATMQCIRRMN